MTCLALKLSHKWHDFSKKLWKKCVFFSFYLQTVWNSSHSMTFWARYKNCTNILRVNYQLFLSHFSETQIILKDFQKTFIKFDTFKFNENASRGSWVVPHRQMNSQADMMKLITHFPNFANAPKHYIFIPMVNFTINDSLEIWSRFKKLKITSVWKHEYSVMINGCPEAGTKTSFSATV